MAVIPLLDPPKPSSLGRDPAATVRQLVALLDKAGVPDQLQASRRLLAVAEALAGATRTRQARAAQRWQVESDRLLAGVADLDQVIDELEVTAVAVGPWLDSDIPAGRGAVMVSALMDKCAAAQRHALAMATAESGAVYTLLQRAAAEVVERVMGVGQLPRAVWAAPPAEAATIAVQEGAGREWTILVEQGTRFHDVHTVAELLRQLGGMGPQMWPPGAPEGVASLYLNWADALAGIEDLKQVVGPLRVRFAADRSWRPGLWTAQDHAQPVEKRRKLALGWVGR
jgi:hypothetical protein